MAKVELSFDFILLSLHAGNFRCIKCKPCSVKRELNASAKTIIQLFFPNEKNSYTSKLKAFADDKINIAKKFNFVSGGVENIERKGE